MTAQTQDAARLQVKLLLKVPEAAEVTGYAPSFLWRLIQRGDLPAVRVGRSVRIRRDDLEAFIDAHRTGGEAG